MVKNSTHYNLLREIPILRKIFIAFDRKAEEKGIHYAALDILERTNSKLFVFGLNNETKEILGKKPVIVACNHPYDIELLALIAALPKRKDIFAIVASDLMGIGPYTKSYFIPVFVHKYFKQGKHKLSVKIAKLLNLGPRIRDYEASQRNRESIEDAASKVRNGGLVVIFPEGILPRGNPWLNGIGYLLTSIRGHRAFYVKAYVEGTSHFDPLRMILGGKLFPPLKVYFGAPQDVSSILRKVDKPRELTQNLQKEYNNWSKTLT